MKKTNYIVDGNRFYFYTETGRIDELGLRRLDGGTEADIYVLSNKLLIKVYKEQLLEEKPQIYNDERILEIASKRDLIRKTTLTYGPMYINDEFKGCIIYYYRKSYNFNYIGLIPSNDYRLNRLIEINDNLRELELNGLYHIDITPSNVLLVKFMNSKIIDIDGKSVRLNDKKGSYQSRMYGNLFDLILDKIFDYQINENDLSDFYIEKAFDGYDINANFIRELNKNKFNYELLKDFLNYLRKDDILKKRLTMK